MSTRAVAWATPCTAFHLPPVRDGHRSLSWGSPRRFERIRVTAWTCHEHRVTFYEFCEAGGLAFIQRTVSDKGKTVVSQSDAWRHVEAQAMWVALLSGMVR
ncbi:hypothetical protein GCM10023075_23180 [Streptosporangium album]